MITGKKDSFKINGRKYIQFTSNIKYRGKSFLKKDFLLVNLKSFKLISYLHKYLQKIKNV